MEKFITTDKKPIEGIQKRADNVKLVIFSGGKKVYVCPHPESHFKDEHDEARKPTKINK